MTFSWERFAAGGSRFVRQARFLGNEVLALAVVSALALSPAHAQPADDPLSTAQALIAAGRLAEARQALAGIDPATVADPTELLFLRGIAALEAGDYDAAVVHFRAILADRPNLPRVRLELARAYFLKGDDDDAARNFELALAGDLPEPVERNVQTFLDAIRARRAWTLDATFAATPDLRGEQVKTLRTPVGDFTSVVPASGFGAFLSVEGGYRWKLDDGFRMDAKASAVQRLYANHDFDDTVLRVETGPRYLFAGGEVGAAATASRRWASGEEYTTALGLEVDGAYWAAPRLQLLGQAAYERVRYDEFDAARDGGEREVEIGARYILTPSSALRAAVAVADVGHGFDWDRYIERRIEFGYVQDLPWGLTVGVEPEIAFRSYDDVFFFYSAFLGIDERDDRALTLSASLAKRDLEILGFVPKLAVAHARVESNIDIYDDVANSVQIGFTRAF